MPPNVAEISGRTRILGLIADPVEQARSPGPKLVLHFPGVAWEEAVRSGR
jgi:hypothetical protein